MLATLLTAARERYKAAPAHGVPQYDPETGERTQCAVSAVYGAAVDEGLCDLVPRAVGELASSADVYGAQGLARWEADTSTRYVVVGFNKAIRAVAV